jgi:hypothetical protein
MELFEERPELLMLQNSVQLVNQNGTGASGFGVFDLI